MVSFFLFSPDEIPDGSNNVVCQSSEYFNSLEAVMDDVSLTGQVFGPGQPNSYMTPTHQQYPPPQTIKININHMASPHHKPGKPTTWVETTCTKNEGCDDYKRMVSYDSGIEDQHDYQYSPTEAQYPTTDIMSASEIEGAIEC